MFNIRNKRDIYNIILININLINAKRFIKDLHTYSRTYYVINLMENYNTD